MICPKISLNMKYQKERLEVRIKVRVGTTPTSTYKFVIQD
jgi:hypothetical protein